MSTKIININFISHLSCFSSLTCKRSFSLTVRSFIVCIMESPFASTLFMSLQISSNASRWLCMLAGSFSYSRIKSRWINTHSDDVRKKGNELVSCTCTKSLNCFFFLFSKTVDGLFFPVLSFFFRSTSGSNYSPPSSSYSPSFYYYA